MAQLDVSVKSVLFLWYTYAIIYLFTQVDTTPPNCPIFVKNVKERPWLFLTLWNLGFQYLWIFYDLIRKVVVKIWAPKHLVDKSDFIRRLWFQAIVFPLTVTVFVYFWPIFLYDREIIYARIVDEFIPWYFNMTSHFMIIVPVFVEFYCTKSTLVDYRIVFTITLLVSSTYTLMMFFWYFWNGEWVYKFYEIGNWPARIFYGALKIVIPTFSLVILYKMKNTEKYSKASVV